MKRLPSLPPALNAEKVREHVNHVSQYALHELDPIPGETVPWPRTPDGSGVSGIDFARRGEQLAPLSVTSSCHSLDAPPMPMQVDLLPTTPQYLRAGNASPQKWGGSSPTASTDRQLAESVAVNCSDVGALSPTVTGVVPAGHTQQGPRRWSVAKSPPQPQPTPTSEAAPAPAGEDKAAVSASSLSQTMQASPLLRGLGSIASSSLPHMAAAPAPASGEGAQCVLSSCLPYATEEGKMDLVGTIIGEFDGFFGSCAVGAALAGDAEGILRGRSGSGGGGVSYPELLQQQHSPVLSAGAAPSRPVASPQSSPSTAVRGRGPGSGVKGLMAMRAA